MECKKCPYYSVCKDDPQKPDYCPKVKIRKGKVVIPE